MAEFTSLVFECQCSRPARLFSTVFDTIPSMMILAPGQKFYSKKQYASGSIELFHITEAIGEDVPTDYWCPASALQMHPVILEDNDSSVNDTQVDMTGAVNIKETLTIKASGSKVYRSYSALEEESTGLKLGDTLTADKRVSVTVNGVTETRYHISSAASEDQTVVGMWIAADRSVALQNGPKVRINSPYVARSIQPMNLTQPAVRDATTETNTATPQPNTVTTPDGNTVTVPDFTVSGDSTSENIVVNQVDINTSMADLYAAYGYDYSASTTSSLMSIPVGRMIFVHGMPFQYTAITDRRDSMAYNNGYTGASSSDANADTESGGIRSEDTDAYGRSFAKEIAANMPIVVLAPGKPKFLTSVQQGIGGYVSEVVNDVRNTFLPMFSAQSDTEYGSILANLNNVEGDYQYYSMEIDTASYFKYVNSLCRTSAYLMGLSAVRYHGKKCPDLDWGDYNTAAEQDFSVFEQVMGLSAGVSFAFDPQSSVSDTITNSTTESQFMSFFNDLSSKAKELEFITGYTGSNIDWFDSTNYVQQATTQLNTGAFAGLQNVVDRIGNWMTNTIHGMNMRFPEIWSDSQNSRSYDIDMHFIAPYATNFCKWRYVLVPFFHLFALAAPKSPVNVSQYSAPFLIRAFSKGYFNVEMGIIESITWKRFGDGDMISQDGVPTQIDVSISFKDLYHTLAMTEFYGDGLGTNVGNFMNNTGLIDLIGTLSGVNMNRVSIAERLALFASSQLSAFGSMGSNFMRDVSDKFRSISDRLHLYGV